MRPFKHQSSIFVSLLSLFLSGVIWILFAPAQLGGSVTYVIVDGNSMETRFHFGDLVLVRTESTYGVGDAVIYQNAEMGRYVFHRIVGTELDRFILKGDNNSWQDSYQPVQDEIIGKLWIHIPKLGRVVEWIRSPIPMALTVALLGGVLMSDMIAKKSGKEKNKSQQIFRGTHEVWLYSLAFLTLIFSGLTIFSFTRPLMRSSANIPYQQEGYFYYSAAGASGVYDTELVRSGEPVFPKLSCFLNLGFTYNLLAAQTQNISGSQQIYARVMDSQSGWQRTIPMTSKTGFSGASYFTMASLDLCQVESLVNLMEQETGLHANIYTLEIITDIAITGEIAGNQFSDTFTPSFAFKFDKMHFYLVNDDPQADVLHLVKQGLAGNVDLQTNTLSIFGLNPTVRSIRVAALLGFGFSLIALLLVASNLYHTVRHSQDAFIRLKYGNMLVEVYEQNLAPTSSTINVTTIDNLARLAERQGTMILHMTHNFLHYYLVQINNTTYRYVIGGSPKIENEPVKREVSEVIPTHNENDPIYAKPEPIENDPPQNMILENKTQVDENKSTSIDTEAVWKKMQNDALNYLENLAKNKILNADPMQHTTQEYAIRTNEIGFYENGPAETILLRKIKV